MFYFLECNVRRTVLRKSFDETPPLTTHVALRQWITLELLHMSVLQKTEMQSALQVCTWIPVLVLLEL